MQQLPSISRSITILLQELKGVFLIEKNVKNPVTATWKKEDCKRFTANYCLNLNIFPVGTNIRYDLDIIEVITTFNWKK